MAERRESYHPLLRRIIADLDDRSGLGLSQLDDDTYNEILLLWEQWADDHDHDTRN